MKVDLINFDPNALDILIFTKQTRLKMSASSFAEIKAWPMEKKLAELEYMRNTIKSSWEFTDYVFLISGVTRAFTHQLVRHRQASYAQQSQRTVNMEGFSYNIGPSLHDDNLKTFVTTMHVINQGYKKLVENGVPAQDARGILPTNIQTNIVMKVNLRSLHEQMLIRLCVKAQGEAQDVYREMRTQVVKVHPWADKFLRVYCATTGTCCFPNFPTKDCPTKPYVYDPENMEAYGGGMPQTLEGIQTVWSNNRAVAQPKGD